MLIPANKPMHPALKQVYKICLAVITGIVMLCSYQHARCQTLELIDHKRQDISFKMVKNLMIIQVTINNKGPFNFVLDTGVGLFIITDPTLIDSLTIENLRNIRITGFGEGEDLSAYVTPSVNVKIGNGIAGDIAAAILKRDAFDLSGFAGMPIHGLIGYEFFNSFIVRINYALNTITVYRPETSYILRKGSKVPITIEEHKPYLISDILLEPGKKVSAKLIIDTGAGHPVSLETNNGLPFDVPADNIEANLGVGLTGPINGYLGRVSSLRLGKFELKNVIAAFPDYQDVAAKITSISRNGNIGNSILKRFDVVFDYGRETMYLRPSFSFKESFEHDMSGMELVSAGKDYDHIIIARVEQGSAAYESGLERGDEILAIDFKPVSAMSMDEITNLFRSRNERNFVLDVLLDNSKKKQRVILTLKRRI